MKRLTGLAALLTAFMLQGCISSSVVLYVAPDGHRRAVITARLFEPAMIAFDSMFSDSPKHAKPADLLPPPGLGELSAQFGAAVTLASTKLDLLQDGAFRTTVVEFADVTRLRIAFPPIVAMPGGTGSFGMGGLSDRPVISFAMKPHENGGRLLLVRLRSGISFVQRERGGDGSAVRLVIKQLNPSTREISVLTPAVEGSTEADTAWTPDGTLLMVNGTALYGWTRGQLGWKEITTLERLSLPGASRLAVSPNGAWLALVGPPRQSR